MNAHNTFRAMIILASFVLVSMITLTFLARMGMIQGIGVQDINETATASADATEELGKQLFNFTSTFFRGMN